MSLLNDALRYLKSGLSVIPLKPGSKEPLVAWTEFQTRRATAGEVQDWFRSTPTANIGLVTGPLSNICVLDADGTTGLLSLKQMGLTSNVRVKTPNEGMHLYYKWTDGIKNSVKKLAPGLDVRGEGGYVVAAGSVHPNGKRYMLLGHISLDAASLDSFPTCILNANVNPVSAPRGILQKPDNWLSEALEEMKNGHVHNTLISVLGKFRAHDFDHRAVIGLLSPFVRQGGMSLEDLEAKVSEIWGRYEAGKQTPAGVSLPSDSGLVIHTPTNPDSVKRYTELRSSVDDGRLLEFTGYGKLDAMLQGGLKSSRLFTVAARTGTGKTNFIIGIARTFCEQGNKVVLFSTETPFNEIWDRYRATLSQPSEFEQHPLFVVDSFSPNLENVEKVLAEVKPELFIFDHINHVSEDPRELAAFFQGMNYLRRKFDCCGIVTAQLNRQADWVDLKTGEKVVPRMSMIKGSGTIEQGSSRVLLLAESRIYPDYTEITGNLDKNDRGPKGLLHFGLYSKPHYHMREL